MATADLPESTWRKSSYSGDNANCVEVGSGPTHAGIRDTKDRDGGSLHLSRRGFSALLRTAQSR